MSKIPTVSVVMPVHNGENYLGEAIESILGQSFRDFEFIVVDDGSIDRSCAIARSYADSRIRVLSAPHRGLVQALNLGLREARGDLVARMDADDISHHDRLERQVEHLRRGPDTVLVGTWVEYIDDEGRSEGEVQTMPVYDDDLRVALFDGNEFAHGSVMMRRSAAMAVGGYRGQFLTAEDYDLWLRMNEIGRIANLPEPLYKLRWHGRSKSAREGIAIAHYSALAQKLAIERLRTGIDSLGYSPPPCGTLRMSQWDRSHTPNMMTLTRWAWTFYGRRDLHTASQLALEALAISKTNRDAWHVLVRAILVRSGALRVRAAFRALKGAL